MRATHKLLVCCFVVFLYFSTLMTRGPRLIETDSVNFRDTFVVYFLFLHFFFSLSFLYLKLAYKRFLT